MTPSEFRKFKQSMLSASDFYQFRVSWYVRQSFDQYKLFVFGEGEMDHFKDCCREGRYDAAMSYLISPMLPSLKKNSPLFYDTFLLGLSIHLPYSDSTPSYYEEKIDEALDHPDQMYHLLMSFNKDIRRYSGTSVFDDLFYLLQSLALVPDDKRPFGLKYAVFHLIAQVVTKRDNRKILKNSLLYNIAYLIEKHHFFDLKDPRDMIMASGDIHKNDFIDEWKEYKLFNSNPVKSVLDGIVKERLQEIEVAKKSQEEGPFKDYLPALTKSPVVVPAPGAGFATRIVRPRIYEVTCPLNDGLYFVVYFHFLEQNGYTQATCYWGNIFDFIMKSVQPEFPGSPYMTLTRPFVKKYPHVASVYGFQDDNKDGRWPYLTTIGWDHQPKEWWLSMRLYDFDFVQLCTLGPLFSDDVANALGNLRDATLAMMRDIQRSDAKQPKLLMNELFGL